MMGWNEGVKSLGATLDPLFVAFFPHPSVSGVLVEAKTVVKTGQILGNLGRRVIYREFLMRHP